MSKLPTWLEAVLGICLVLALWSWLSAHNALRDALAQKDVLMHEKADLQGRIEAAGKAEQAANQALEAERSRPATVQTVTKFLPAPLPNGSEIGIQTSPEGKPQLVVTGDPQANLNAIQDMEIKCLECTNSLAARNAQFADLQKQLTLSEQNAKNWEKSAGRKTGFWAHAKDWGIRLAFAGGGYAAGRLK